MATLARNLFVFRSFTSKFTLLPELNVTLIQSRVRNSSYVASEKEKSSDSYTTFHKVSSENWKYVERLLPSATIPSFPLKEDYPSGWTPPADSGLDLPFFVPRNKNHMMPVYLNFEAIRRERKITIVRHIEGDIWELERRLKAHLDKVNNKTTVSQVHEVAMFIKFKGDHVSIAREWLINCGF